MRQLTLTYVFISYSHHDIDYVTHLNADLEKNGFKTWFDRRIEIGSAWVDEIEAAIRGCAALLVVISQESLESSWVKKEILVAEREQKRIFPLLLNVDELRLLLIDKHYLKLKRENNFLPTINFYRDLAKYVPRISQLVESPDYQLFNLPILGTKTNVAPRVIKKVKPSISIKIGEWLHCSKAGTNDFYGIAMLALSYEQTQEHKRAMYFLRKAQKLEPRIADKKWMTENYSWTEQHHALLQIIINDPDFWNTSLRG